MIVNMPIKVQDILELPEFSDAKIIAGEQGVDNNIKNASLMEVPDIFPYLDAGNLLLTTLFPIYENEEAKKELIPKLVEQNLAGICIKPARYIDEIPEIMIKQANELNFPLIKLSDDANLSTLVNKILEISLNKHVDILKFRNEIHEKLMELFLSGESLDSLVEHLSKMIDLPIILTDNNFNITHLSNHYQDKEVEVQGESKHNSQIEIKVDEQIIPKNKLIIHSIKAGNQFFGYIITLKNENNMGNSNLQVAIEQASLLIATVFHKNNAVLEKEKNFQNAFIRNILQGKIKSQVEAVEKAKAFGWKLEFPQIIMTIKIFTEDELAKKNSYEYILNSDFIENIFAKKIALYNDKINTIYINDSLVVFINATNDNNICKSIKKIAEEMIEKINVNFKVGISISNIIERIGQFPNEYKKIEKSIKLSDILYKDSFVTNFDELKMFNIIEKVDDFELLNQYVDDKLGKLILYERDNDLDLMPTLKVLIENNFNLKKSAEKMYIHYNTIRYRVEKIKELGINIETGYDIGELVFAYNIFLWLVSNDKLDL